MQRVVARVALVLAVALPAAAEEHVTVPAPLGQANKETVVKPSGTLKDTGYGIVSQGDPASRVRTAPARPGAPDAGVPAGYAPPAANTGPTGQAVVEASYLTIRGTVTGFEPGKSVAVLDRNGKTRTLALLKGAAVYEGLKVGDAVSVRVPVEDSGACRSADRVERQKTAPTAMPSKFTQARAN
jgi:hypothetical protein